MPLVFTILLALLLKPARAETGPRIVALTPALTEIIFALGGQKHLVAVTEFSDYPAEAKNLPRVGSYAAPSIEKIILAKPDIVLLGDEGVNNIGDALTKAKIRSRVYKMKSLSDFAPTVTDLGALLNASLQAQKLVASWTRRFDELKKIESSRRVIIQVDHDPIFVAGDETFLSELVERCGGVNDMKFLKGFRQPSLEALSQIGADTILVTAQVKSPNLKTEIQKFWKKQPLKKMPRILFFDPDLLSRLSPRLPLAAKTLCERLQK